MKFGRVADDGRGSRASEIRCCICKKMKRPASDSEFETFHMAAAEASDQYASAAMTEKELADAANLARRRIASFAEAHGFEVVDPNKQIEDDAAEEQELPDPSALAAEPVDRPPTPPRRRSRSPAVSPSTDAGQISPQAFVKPKRLISRSFPSTTSTPDEFARQPPSEPFAPAALHPRSASRGASSSCSSSLPPPPPPSSHENPPTPPTHCWSGILTCLPWATTPEQPPAEPPPPEPPPPAPPPGPQLELLHASSLQTLEALEGTRTPSPAATLPLPAWAVAPGWPPSEAGATAVSDVSLAPQTPPRDPEDLPAAPMHVHLAAREAARLAVASGAAPDEVVAAALSAAQSALAHGAAPQQLLLSDAALHQNPATGSSPPFDIPASLSSPYGLESDCGSERPLNIRGPPSVSSDMPGVVPGAANERLYARAKKKEQERGGGGGNSGGSGGSISHSHLAPSPARSSVRSATENGSGAPSGAFLSNGLGVAGSDAAGSSLSPLSPLSPRSPRQYGTSKPPSPAPAGVDSRGARSPPRPLRRNDSSSPASSGQIPSSSSKSPSSAGRSPGRRRPSHPPNLWQEKLGDLAEVAHQRAEEAEQRALAAVEPRMAAVVRAAVAHERLYQKHKEKLKAIELKRAESVKAVYKPHDKIEREFTMVKGSKGGGGFSFGSQSRPSVHPSSSTANVTHGIGSSGGGGGGGGDASASSQAAPNGTSPGSASQQLLPRGSSGAISAAPPSPRGVHGQLSSHTYAATGSVLVTQQGLSFTSTVPRETPGPGAYDTVKSTKSILPIAQPTSVAFKSQSSRTVFPWEASPEVAGRSRRPSHDPPPNDAQDGASANGGAGGSGRRKSVAKPALTKCNSDITTPGPGAYTSPPSSFAAANKPSMAAPGAAPASPWARDRSDRRLDFKLETFDRMAPSPLQYSPSHGYCSR